MNTKSVWMQIVSMILAFLLSFIIEDNTLFFRCMTLYWLSLAVTILIENKGN